jgi:pimeloyl-ACP methyl ester carboxylesterase
MNSTIGSTLVLALLLYGAGCLFLYLTQRNFIYYPTPESHNPAAIDLRIPSGEETLQVWQLNPGREQAILYFGGNAEDVAGNTPAFAGTFPDFTVYLVNYRGYGASSGAPTESGLFADAEAVHDQIAKNHRSVHLIGRSLGSGVAVHLASVREVGRLALITPYDSIANVASSAMPIFPVKWLLKDRFDSARLAGKLVNPTLALLAENDRVIPRARSEQLVAAFQPRIVTAVTIPHADHNTIGMLASYWESLKRFMEDGNSASHLAQ